MTALQTAGQASNFEITFVSRGNADEVQEAVHCGDAEVGPVLTDTLYTARQTDGRFPVVVAQAVATLETGAECPLPG